MTCTTESRFAYMTVGGDVHAPLMYKSPSTVRVSGWFPVVETDEDDDVVMAARDVVSVTSSEEVSAAFSVVDVATKVDWEAEAAAVEMRALVLATSLAAIVSAANDVVVEASERLIEALVEVDAATVAAMLASAVKEASEAEVVVAARVDVVVAKADVEAERVDAEARVEVAETVLAIPAARDAA